MNVIKAQGKRTQKDRPGRWLIIVFYSHVRELSESLELQI